MRGLDRLLAAAIVLLVAFTPLAFGAVHPWAYSLAEAWIFGLLIVLAAKLWLAAPGAIIGVSAASSLRQFVVPLGLFSVLIAFEILPIPPRVLRVLSPMTYSVYQKTLPGWPSNASYLNLQAVASADGSSATLAAATPTNSKAELAKASALHDRIGGSTGESLSQWRPLAVAWPLAWSGLLAMLGCICLFVVIVAYPLSANISDERTFVFSIVAATVTVGLLVGVVGIVETAWWNGKILWVFTPLEYGVTQFPQTRARGSFIDPDHFAGYLTMILPLAVSLALAGSNRFSTKRRILLRWLCAATAVVAFAGIVMSLSRNGLLGTLTALAVLAALLGWPGAKSNRSLSSFGPFGIVRLAMVIVFVVLGAALLLGRADADASLATTLTRGGTSDRVWTWTHGLGLLRDFSSFGVGLGGWPAMYSRYQGVPHPFVYFSRAHNDYLELAAESGLAGLGLLLFFFYRVGNSIRRGLRFLSPESTPLVAGMLAGLTAMAVEEFFDFDLQVPANAFLFTIFAALAIRLTSATSSVVTEGARRRNRWIAAVATLTGTTLIVASATQGHTSYPYNIESPATLAQADDILVTYPTTWYSHVVVAWRLGACAPRALQEQSIAVWLDPTNPLLRDAYAENLDCAGRQDEALTQLTNSVLFSPEMGTHSYLSQEKILASTSQQRSAIERGLKLAVGRQYAGAADTLAAYYDALGRYAEEGAVLAAVAARETDHESQEKHSLAAGTAYAHAQEWKQAEDSFRKAARSEPADTAPIEDMLDLVYTPIKDSNGAKALVEEAVSHGVDPYPLWIALGKMLRDVGRLDEAEHCFHDAMQLHPSGFEALYQLGLLYRQEGHLGQAIISFQRATEVRPSSGETYFQLAVAEEDDFDYSAADRDYSTASSLEPNNAGLKSQFENFKRKVASNAAKPARSE